MSCPSASRTPAQKPHPFTARAPSLPVCLCRVRSDLRARGAVTAQTFHSSAVAAVRTTQNAVNTNCAFLETDSSDLLDEVGDVLAISSVKMFALIHTRFPPPKPLQGTVVRSHST